MQRNASDSYKQEGRKGLLVLMFWNCKPSIAAKLFSLAKADARLLTKVSRLTPNFDSFPSRRPDKMSSQKNQCLQ